MALTSVQTRENQIKDQERTVGKGESMKISELIMLLRIAEMQYGDLPITTQHCVGYDKYEFQISTKYDNDVLVLL